MSSYPVPPSKSRLLCWAVTLLLFTTHYFFCILIKTFSSSCRAPPSGVPCHSSPFWSPCIAAQGEKGLSKSGQNIKGGYGWKRGRVSESLRRGEGGGGGGQPASPGGTQGSLLLGGRQRTSTVTLTPVSGCGKPPTTLGPLYTRSSALGFLSFTSITRGDCVNWCKGKGVLSIHSRVHSK